MKNSDANCPYLVISSVADFPDTIRFGFDMDKADLIKVESGTNCVPLITRGTGKKKSKRSGSILYQQNEVLTAFPAGSIAVPQGGSVAHAKRILRPFYVGRDVYVLIPKKKERLSDYEIAYHIQQIRNQKWRYGQSRQMNTTFSELEYQRKPPKIRVKLPLVKFCKSHEEFKKKASKLTWGEVELSKVGRIFRPKRTQIKMDIVLPGDGRKGHPYVSAGVEHNKNVAMMQHRLGNPRRVEVRNYSNATGVRHVPHGELIKPQGPANTIAFNYNADVGHAAFQEEQYFCRDECNILIPEKEYSHPLVQIFISACIRKEGWRWGTNRLMTPNKIRATGSAIHIPVGTNGEIDVKGIKKAMKKLPLYSRVLKRPQWYHWLKIFFFGV